MEVVLPHEPPLPRVSFVIPTWNQRTLLAECLSSIVETTKGIAYEVIVVDNGSPDDTTDVLGRHFQYVTVVRNRENRGYAAAINQGAARARGDVLCLLNDDVRLTAGCVETLLSCLAEKHDAGAAVPLLHYPTGELQISCRRFPTPAGLVLELLGISHMGPLRRWKLTAEEHLHADVVLQPMASVLLVKRACWNAVGPLDERFPIYFNDTDWCYRLYRTTGYKIILCSGARAIHHHGASTRRLGAFRRVEFLKGLMRFYWKHWIHPS